MQCVWVILPSNMHTTVGLLYSICVMILLVCRVSYCTVDPYYDKVFCYISRNHENKKLECHAFLCSKKSKVREEKYSM